MAGGRLAYFTLRGTIRGLSADEIVELAPLAYREPVPATRYQAILYLRDGVTVGLTYYPMCLSREPDVTASLVEIRRDEADALRLRYGIGAEGRATPHGPRAPTPEENRGPAPRPQGMKRKQPPPGAFTAYRLVKLLGWKQVEVQDLLGVDQSTVSRWVGQVRRWLEAGNVLPESLRDEPPRRRPMTMDPRKLDQGPRLDRRRNASRRKKEP